MAGIVEEIYDQYKKPVYNYFYRSTYSSHTAEELTQDTFLKAFRYLNTFKGESSMKTWLFKIARNTYLNHIRKMRNMREEDITDLEVISQDDSFSQSDERLLIRKILHNLSEEERSLVLLRDLNGFSYSEISSIMGYTEGQVKIGLHRARKKFREMYDNENGEG
jgi:RNA polymerase sigma-70 factor, ECF subfamily